MFLFTSQSLAHGLASERVCLGPELRVHLTQSERQVLAVASKALHTATPLRTSTLISCPLSLTHYSAAMLATSLFPEHTRHSLHLPLPGKLFHHSSHMHVAFSVGPFLTTVYNFIPNPGHFLAYPCFVFQLRT